MIDEKKYEGHPLAPWGWRHKVAEYRLTANGDKLWIDIQVDEDTDPTVMALIADAPLLLAEVKRQAKVIGILTTHNSPDFDTCLALHEEEVCGGVEGCFICEEIENGERENEVVE